MTATIEGILEIWQTRVEEIKERIRPLFSQQRVAENAGRFLEGLLGNEARKTGWRRAEAAGDKGPWKQQAILGRRPWNADALRDVVRGYVVENFGEEAGVIVIDETGFLKQGKASCGVGRQYTGSAGKITNCQVGVFAAYVSSKGHAFIDRRLYLPKEWTENQVRRAATHVPTKTDFATKPSIAKKMIQEAIGAQVPFSWVTADSVYGVSTIESALKRAAKGYVLGVTSKHHYTFLDNKGLHSTTAGKIARDLDPSLWKRLSCGEGTKGAKLYDWAYYKLRDLDIAEYNAEYTGLWSSGLLIRRSLSDGELAYFSTWCPAKTDLQTLVNVEGSRWAIEDSFETTKNELGLDHNETRSWHAWHRHVSLVMLAFALVAAIRYRANTILPKKTMPKTTPLHTDTWFVGLSRKFGISPPAY